MMIRPPPRLTNRALLEKYLEVDLWSWMREITSAFTQINFQQNFQAFFAPNVSIPAGQQVSIINQFRNGVIPSGRIITRQTGNAVIVDGPTDWTANTLYLSNPSLNDAVITVLFFL
jgi:hypothetical protein